MFQRLAPSFSAVVLLFVGFSPVSRAAENRPPNVIIIFADDLGYGDLGCYGNEKNRTPRLDRMAREGQRWTSFYAADNVCTPSRAALLTGRYAVRSGMASTRARVLFPRSKGGLPDAELTIAEVCKSRGYATAAFGKWHLGHLPQYLPTKHGFDTYFGIPYSNDMDRLPSAPRDALNREDPKHEWFNLPILRDETVVERPAVQSTITRRFTDEAIGFIESHQDKPFFIYLAHNLPHVPLFASEEFRHKSPGGFYGDVIEEIDFNVGRILDTLKKLNLDKNTLVIFTSDNGPWLVFKKYGGSAGPLREGKGTTFEGGHRVPGIVWWPETIKPAIVDGLGSTLDLLPTIASLIDAKLPDDLVLDGYDLSLVFKAGDKSPRHEMFFYRGSELFAARLDDHKAHFTIQGTYGSPPQKAQPQDPALLYNLAYDPSETKNLAAEHPEIIAEIKKRVDAHKATLVKVENQLEK